MLPGSRGMTLSATVMLTIFIHGAGGTRAEAPDEWRSGAELRRQLMTVISVSFGPDSPLRDSLETLAGSQRICIFLDRRVDPSRPIGFTVRNESLQVALDKLAAELDAGVCTVDAAVYLGPRHVAERLPTLTEVKRDEARRLPAALQKQLLTAETWSWQRLATPRELVQQLTSGSGLSVVGLERIPHDLWPAVTLPPLDRIQRLSLVLANFDLTFEMDPATSTLRLVPFPEKVELRRDYPGGTQVVALVDRLRRLVPDADIERSGTRIGVTGSLEHHQAVERLLRGGMPERPAAASGEQRYSLYVPQAPLSAIVTKLAAEWMLELEISPAAEAGLDKVVTFHVEDVPREDLLGELLIPNGFFFRLEGTKLQLDVAKD